MKALGFKDIEKFGREMESLIDEKVRRDSRYTFGNKPFQDDQLRYEYAVELKLIKDEQ
jgi:hypothetical protein